MKVKSKSDAIEYFQSAKKLMEKYPPPTIRLPDGNSMDLNGVFFSGDNAYMTNNVFVARVKVDDDFPLNESIGFYAFAENLQYISPDDLKKAKGAKHGPFSQKDFGHLDYLCNSRQDNQFFIRRRDVLQLLDSMSLKTMPTCVGIFEIMDTYVSFKIKDKRGKVDMEHKLPRELFPDARNIYSVSGATLCLNLFYIYEIFLSAFSHCDIMGVKFDSSPNMPAVFFNSGHCHPGIYWAVAQTIKN